MKRRFLPRSAPQLVKRDGRRRIQRSLIYRRRGGCVWYHGEIKDISPTGLLFRGEQIIAVPSLIEVSFTLPRDEEHHRDVDIFCWCKVVRTLPPVLPEGHPALAAHVLRYRSDPKPLPDVRRIIGEVRGPFSTKVKHQAHAPTNPKNLQEDEEALVVLSGSIASHEDAAVLEQKLQDRIAAGAKVLLLECSLLHNFVGCGVLPLARAHVSLARRGGKLKLLNISSQVRERLADANLLSIIETADDAEEALNEVAKPR